MNIEELKKYALAAKLRPDLHVEQVVYRVAANPTSILALIAEIARFKQDAEMAAASLNLLTGHHEHLLAEFDRVTKQRDKLLAALELFMERVDEPPESNCSCHISPPCNDCVEYSGLREAFSDAHDAIAKAEG